jgi:membrane associated rhomboid family serine protease
MILVLLVFVGVAYYVMKPDERARLLTRVLALIHRAKTDAIRRHQTPEPFRDALRARTPLPVVTAALVGLNVLIFLFMLVGSGSFSDPLTLIGWGGSFAPRTTNAEWWRLVASMFVHPGFFALVINVAAIVSVGLILERLVGHFAFAVVYFAAGILASLVSLSTYPMAVSIGPSGGIFGLYGLLLASSMWNVLDRSALAIPLERIKVLAPIAAIFLLYNLSTDNLPGDAELVALIAGIACGLALTKGVGEAKPPARRVAVPLAATLMTAVVFAVPLRGVTDARPEIARVVSLEDRTAETYKGAVDKFTKGWMNADELIGVINRTIMPELQATRARVKALGKVPPEQQPLVANAEEYFRLRDDSWRLRAAGLRRSDMATLRAADKTERASLEVLEKLRPIQ